MTADYRAQQQADALLRTIDARIDQKIAEAIKAPTGITPGVQYSSFIARADGRIEWGGAGASNILLAYYDTTGGLTITDGTTERLNFNHQIEDPQSLVTTGASWAFTPAVSGYYACSIYFTWYPSGGDITSGGFTIDRYHGGVNDVSVWEWDAPGTIPASTKQSVCFRTIQSFTNGQAINFRLDNGTGQSMVFTNNTPWIEIEKVYE
jgi:hypothetical protein